MQIIKKSLKPNIASEKMDIAGTTGYVSWERLLPYIKQSISLKPSEELRGLEIDENGIKVLINIKTK